MSTLNKIAVSDLLARNHRTLARDSFNSTGTRAECLGVAKPREGLKMGLSPLARKDVCMGCGQSLGGT